MKINKGAVSTSAQLQQYLQECSLKSPRLFHYTTYESLVCIIKNMCFRLSRMDLMNDKAEQTLGIQDERIKNYILSFTRDKEYVSMWAMYGRPSGIKLRVDFDRELFYKTVNRNFYKDNSLKQRISINQDNNTKPLYKKELLLSDIVYLNKTKNELVHNEKSFQNIKATKDVIDDMTGFIKYDAWEFEREVRLRVLIRHELISGDVPKYIYAAITQELIRDFHITFNPWLSTEMKEEIRKSLDTLAGYNLSYNNSQNDGEISEL